MDWCEVLGTNRMIVCLDQEKAYNRILHPFLWASLQHFNFPNEFIGLVKALYIVHRCTDKCYPKWTCK